MAQEAEAPVPAGLDESLGHVFRHVPGDLEPEAAKLTVAVVRAPVVTERRRPRPRPVDTHEEDVATRDPLFDEVGEELAPVQPQAAGEPPLPYAESGEPPGGSDYVERSPEPGAIRSG